MRNEWTYRDVETLKREFPRRPTAEVAKMLGRSCQATSVKAHKLGLKKTGYGFVWTPSKIKLLTDFFPIMFNRPLAKWVGVSMRTLIRKARELGLEKEPGFLERRREDIGDLVSEALKRTGFNNGRFRKGVRNCPEGEFKKGHVESPETKAKRSASLKATWRKRKQREELKYYGIGITR